MNVPMLLDMKEVHVLYYSRYAHML